MTESSEIVAYLWLGAWYTPEEVHSKRAARAPELTDANPYTFTMLHRRREYGRDVPDWINLDEANHDR